VSTAPPVLTLDERRRKLRDGAARFASQAAMLGASEEEAAAALAAAWRGLWDGQGGSE
jgi:hypothetical protein